MGRLENAQRRRPTQHYRKLLLALGEAPDPLVAAVYAGSNTRIKEPRHLAQPIADIDWLDWYSARTDGLGDLTRACWRKTPMRPRAVPANTSPRAR